MDLINNGQNESDLMSAYVEEVESAQEEKKKIKKNTQQVQEENPVINPEPRKSMAEIARENRLHGRTDLPVTGDGGLTYRDNIGYLKLPVNELPSMGMFYPEGIEISIRAARGEEIKHWSTMNEKDYTQLSRIDDILSYMIEKCCSVRIPGVAGNCWKDIKNVDRFYILLAIREFTFLDGNDLMVPLSETESIPVRKEMIDFIKIPEEVMKFYDSEKKCFVFTIDGNAFNMHVPSIGVNNWLKNYSANKTNSREMYDEDFLNFAPMLIKDYRNLSVRAYEEMVGRARMWSAKEWSVISYVSDILSGASEPKVKYTDSNGSEVEIPLNFRGGIKAIFLISNPLQSIC